MHTGGEIFPNEIESCVEMSCHLQSCLQEPLSSKVIGSDEKQQVVRGQHEVAIKGKGRDAYNEMFSREQ